MSLFKIIIDCYWGSGTKKYFILLFMLILFQPKIMSQNSNFLPMTIGNEYQYTGVYNYFYWKMDRDTIYPNGNRYYTFPGWLEFGDCRIDSSGNVLSISKPFFGGGKPDEYLLFKADAQLNEIWPIAWNFNTIIDTGYGRCIYDDTIYVFDKPRRVRGTLIFDESYYYFFFWLADGIGIIRTQYDDGSTLDLNYAKINGTVYGELVSVLEEYQPKPVDFNLYQNYPNPFNPTTTIKFSLGKREIVSIIVFDITGKKIKSLVNQELSAGDHEIQWNGKDENNRQLPSGIYFIRMHSSNYQRTIKVTLLK